MAAVKHDPARRSHRQAGLGSLHHLPVDRNRAGGIRAEEGLDLDVGGPRAPSSSSSASFIKILYGPTSTMHTARDASSTTSRGALTGARSPGALSPRGTWKSGVA